MNGLVEFLRARLDEDVEVARAAADCHDEDSPTWAVITPGFVHNGEDGMWSRLTSVDRPAVADHMVRFDPARVLAEVDAKRETIRLYEEACAFIEMMKEQGKEAPAHVGAAEAYLNVIRDDAAVYADHPDYQEEWRP